MHLALKNILINSVNTYCHMSPGLRKLALSDGLKDMTSMSCITSRL